MKHRIGLIVLYYLRFFARLQLKKNPSATIIGITGSSGKTSTRLAIVHILKHKGIVKHSSHANSESGIPLNILGITPHNYRGLDWFRMILLAPLAVAFNWEHYNYYVVEMGIDGPDSPKNMDYLLTILEPHIGVILNAGLVHGFAFDHLVSDKNPARRAAKIRKEIAKEKFKLLQSLGRAGVAVINNDQKEFVELGKNLNCRVFSYGKKSKSTLRIDSVSFARSFKVKYHYQDLEYELARTSPLEEAYAYTFAAAAGAAAAIGVKLQESLEYLHDFVPPSGRMRIFEGIKSTHIIDSSYNASPDSMLSSLKFLDKVSGKSHRLAILGDMRELGRQSKSAHKELADWIMKYTDECVLFGTETGEHTAPVLVSSHFPCMHFDSMQKLTRYIRDEVKSRSWVLVKGSQNTILLERAVEALLQNKSEKNKLCRRGKYWDRVRTNTP